MEGYVSGVLSGRLGGGGSVDKGGCCQGEKVVQYYLLADFFQTSINIYFFLDEVGVGSDRLGPKGFWDFLTLHSFLAHTFFWK